MAHQEVENNEFVVIFKGEENREVYLSIWLSKRTRLMMLLKYLNLKIERGAC